MGKRWQETIRTENGKYKVEKYTYKTVSPTEIVLSMLTDSGWERLEDKPTYRRNTNSFHKSAEKEDFMIWAYKKLRKFYDESTVVEASYNPPFEHMTDMDKLREDLGKRNVKGFELGDTHYAWRWNRNKGETILGTPGHTDPYQVPYVVSIDGEDYPLYERRIQGELTADKYVKGLKKAINKAEKKGIL